MTRQQLKNLKFELELALREAYADRDVRRIKRLSQNLIGVNKALEVTMDIPHWRKIYEQSLW
ncbi:MAG: hypothetical protein JRI66_11290 [Deltaproteobacteria bacterium]|nr:hypothetical protein [Deltaproteobacteria bacterium]